MTPEGLAADLVEKLRALGWLNHNYPFVRNSLAGIIRVAIAEEREACARAAETCELSWEESGDGVRGEIAAAIRARP